MNKIHFAIGDVYDKLFVIFVEYKTYRTFGDIIAHMRILDGNTRHSIREMNAMDIGV